MNTQSKIKDLPDKIKDIVDMLPTGKQGVVLDFTVRHYVGWYPSPVPPPVFIPVNKFKYKIF